MEKIKPTHIGETNSPHTYEGETFHERDNVNQEDEYDTSVEIHPEQIRVREFLNSLDEDVLANILHNYYRRSGSENYDINYIPIDRVRIVHKTPEEEQAAPSPHGSYSVRSGIQIYGHTLETKHEALWTLIHEECHAISQKKIEEYRLLDEDDVVVGTRSVDEGGLETIEKSTGKLHSPTQIKNRQINEGVTELLTERIFREYLQQSGQNVFGERPEEAPEDWKQMQIEEAVADHKFNAYERNWKNAKFYINLISALVEIPQDVVEEGVIRAYARNGTLVLDEEIISALEEKHEKLPSIILHISNSDEQSGSITELVQYLAGRHNLPPDITNQLSKAINKVKEEWGEAYTHSSKTV